MTEEVFRFLEECRFLLRKELGNGATLRESADSTAIRTAAMVGKIEGITLILDMDATDIEGTLYAR